MHQISYSRIVMLALAVCFVTHSGCRFFGENKAETEVDNSVYARHSDRATPWVKEVEAVSYLESDDKDYLLDDLGSDKFRQSVKSMMGKGPNRDAAMQLMSEADKFYDQANSKRDSEAENFRGDYLKAASLYKNAAERWPKSSLEQDALFRSGESFFFADSYVNANAMYEKLVAAYRGTRYMDIVQARRFSIAEYWQTINQDSPDNLLTFRYRKKDRPTRDTGGNALRIFDKIRLDDPTGDLADDATMALANGYFSKGRFMDASDTYEDLRRTYPNSEHIFDAYMYEMRARLEAYQGKDYDGTNLAKAEQLMKTMVTQFPTQLEEHREVLKKEGSRIRKLKAERELAMAKYYENRGENRAAAIHYNEIARNYRDTALGEKAVEKVAELGQLPPEPGQPLEWLARLFPESEKSKPLLPASDKDTLLR